ncbi:ExbD/TolR family protein [Aestuariibius sp. 2305UL40-4]|uniref:ExbD/TolR family protein n=1 Tax=Aestuariibius violaceus TaxID=3234132 RepID=UPI00345E99E2
MRRLRRRPGREPTIALINIVFLMLVFFMVAGTLAPAMEGDVALIQTSDLDGREPPNALVIHEDGSLRLRGATVPSATVAYGLLDEGAREAVRIVPDRDLSARTLLTVSNDLRRAGADRILIVTERGMR